MARANDHNLGSNVLAAQHAMDDFRIMSHDARLASCIAAFLSPSFVEILPHRFTFVPERFGNAH